MVNASIPINRSIELVADTLAGILDWNNLDQIWQHILQADSAGWHLYRPDNSRSGIINNQSELQPIIESLSKYLRHSHPRDYCGIVFADSVTKPSLVRVFDPKYLTSMCNIYGNTPAPDWVFSKMNSKQLIASNKASSKLKNHSLGKKLPPVFKHPQVKDTLDARRMGCPLPLIHTARLLKHLAVGEILEIISIDPGAINDIEYLCECTGSKHLALAEGEHGYSFYILRR